MAAITPSTNLFLLKNPNNLSNENQLTFANATAQYNYFSSLQKLMVDDFTYQRKDYSIRYPACVDDIIDYNYVMYQNEAYTDKWYYAYIKQMRWVNDKVTDIIIETDPFQTFMFDLVYKASFVEREHVNNDTIGLHTIPEDLDTGEYVIQQGTETALQTQNLFYLTNRYFVVSLTEIPGYTVPSAPNGRLYGDIYSACYQLVFKSATDLDLFILKLQGIITQDVINSIYIIPASIVSLTSADFQTWNFEGENIELAYMPFSTSEQNMGDVAFNKETFLDQNYIPRNNKLFCYPYRYLILDNNAGSAQTYKYELFSTSTCGFNLRGVAHEGCSIKLTPISYNKGSKIEGLDAAKLPVCNWNNDAYTNWLTQNALNLSLNRIKNTVGLVGGTIGAVVTGGTTALMSGAVAINSGLAQLDAMKSKYEVSLTPITASGGVNQGNLNYSWKQPFNYYKMSIKKEYAEIIDSYFDINGYKVNKVKIPNITGRLNWNYVKTIGANIEGLIPEFYLDEIKNMFNNGVTLWHNPTTFLDYSQTNSIVT